MQTLLALLLLASAPAAQDCSGTSVGFTPLNDLIDGFYLGAFEGGLYPGGVNHRPAAHDQAGLQQAALVLPRDAAGDPDPAGKIALLSIGMSNTTAEFSAFQSLVPGAALNPRLVLVDGAVGGVPVEDMDDPADPYWSIVAQRLMAAGVSRNQVQAVWLKQTNRAPTAAFPGWAENLRDQLRSVVQILKVNFPNLRLCYLTGRGYAGYATTTLNPEPYAYETSFADKWLIRDQIQGDPLLNFDPATGLVLAPWLAWGPYIWADGLIRRSDGMRYECSDYISDGTHMTQHGWNKVGAQIVDFFLSDGTTRSWFLANPGAPCAPQALVEKYGTGSGGPNGTAQLVASLLPTVPTVQPLRLFGFAAPPQAAAGIGWGLAPLADGAVPFLGGSLLVQPLEAVGVVTNPDGQATLDLGLLPNDPVFCGAEIFAQFVVQDPDSLAGWDVSRGLRVRAGH